VKSVCLLCVCMCGCRCGVCLVEVQVIGVLCVIGRCVSRGWWCVQRVYVCLCMCEWCVHVCFRRMCGCAWVWSGMYFDDNMCCCGVIYPLRVYMCDVCVYV